MKVGTISYKVLGLYILLSAAWVLLPYNFLKVSFTNHEDYETFFTIRIIYLAFTGLVLFVLVQYMEKKLIGKLDEANKSLNIFLYKTHHDIRGPVKTLIGLTEMAKTSYPSEVAEECIQKTIEVSQRMDILVNKLAHLSEIDEKQDSNAPIDCHRLINDSLEQINSLLQPGPVKINVEMQPGAGFYGDYNLIQTIFYCLLENAFVFQKPNAPDAKIDINLGCDDLAGRFTISDNGIGMDEKTQSKAFDMFYKGNHQSIGSGLGLYLVKKALEKIKGTITIQSAPARGTRVTIEIPNRHPAQLPA
jgi:signal transduction histidine kinase